MKNIHDLIEDVATDGVSKAHIRPDIRALFEQYLIDGGFENEIAKHFKSSEIVGTGPTQINPRPTIAGLRDALAVEVIAYIILHDKGMESLEAIASGEMHEDGSAKSKTGFRLGHSLEWPADLDAEVFGMSSTEPTEPTPSYSLNEWMEIIAVMVVRDHDGDDVLDAIAEIETDTAKVKGIREMVDIGGVLDDVPENLIDKWEKTGILLDLANLIDGDSGDATDVADDSVDVAPVPTKTTVYPVPDEDKSRLIDLALSQAGLPPVAEMIGVINNLTEEVERRAIIPTVGDAGTKSIGDEELPSGKVTTALACDVFGLKGVKRKTFNFDVPVWEWDFDHPHVPTRDHNYQFQAEPLMRVLYAVITNSRCYLHGHTGSGKTTLIEQVASCLNYPFMRVNFDSEITRMDLIGRDVLTTSTDEHGNQSTISSFVDGILPQMMSGPYIGCFDEIDFVRPDVSYVMQRVLEDKGLMITEDGGRIVAPHKMFRMFATGNTVGQGDEFGMYQGARPQSLAFLDRFTVWSHIDYMPKHLRKKLIEANCPSLDVADLDRISNYVDEHLQAFKDSKVMQPISPRGYVALGQAVQAFYQFFESDKQKAFNQAFETTILDRATVQDRVVLQGIGNRLFD
tara:strand:+ start:1610 stop:3487 length:1878 start_codon:yes stop_codon:yes gene_type:complete